MSEGLKRPRASALQKGVAARWLFLQGIDSAKTLRRAELEWPWDTARDSTRRFDETPD